MRRRPDEGEAPAEQPSTIRTRDRLRGSARMLLFLPLLLFAYCALILPSSRSSDSRRDTPLVAARAGEPPPAPVPASPSRPRAPVPAEPVVASDRTLVAHSVVAKLDTREPERSSSPTRATVTITVRNSGTGEPIADAYVELGHTLVGADDETVVIRRADAHGLVSIEIEPGTLRFAAWSGARVGGPDFVEILGAESISREVMLELGFELAGRVVDQSTGLPIHDAEVKIWTFAERDVVRTLADGSFRHERFPRTEFAEQIRVDAPGYGGTVRYLRMDAEGNWELPAVFASGKDRTGTGVPWVEIALVPELRITGRIANRVGEPISRVRLAGASVSAEGYYHALPSVASLDGATVQPGESGAFVIERLRSDISHSVLISVPGFADKSIEIPAGHPGTLELGSISLARESILSGVVLDPSGFPVQDVAVTVVPLATSNSVADADMSRDAEELDVRVRIQGFAYEARTSPEGTFVIEHLREAAYRVIVARDADALLEQMIEPIVGGEFASLELRLPDNSLTLRGRVDGTEGLDSVIVTVERFGHVARVRPDRDGSFRIAGLDDREPYILSAIGMSSASGLPLSASAEAYAFEEPVLALEKLVGASSVELAQLSSK